MRGLGPTRQTLLGRRRLALAGFTLVEVGVAGIIIGLMAAIALPAMKRMVLVSQANALANDLRVLSGALQSYAQQNGGYPADANVGVVPTGLRDYSSSANWQKVTAIGGCFNWEAATQSLPASPFRAAIAVNTSGSLRPSTDRTLLLTIDQRIDDGNLATGNFLLGNANQPLYIIER